MMAIPIAAIPNSTGRYSLADGAHSDRYDGTTVMEAAAANEAGTSLSGPCSASTTTSSRLANVVYSPLVTVPVIGIGGIATLDDVMEFLVAGASAVQLGTANFYDPTAAIRILDGLPAALASLGASGVREVVSTLRTHLGNRPAQAGRSVVVSNDQG